MVSDWITISSNTSPVHSKVKRKRGGINNYTHSSIASTITIS
uniref:Uncharacterized protein n=1 Tax=Arundo donax TaxID=35708 RepID=A0A0A9CAG2_ARUDO